MTETLEKYIGYVKTCIDDKGIHPAPAWMLTPDDKLTVMALDVPPDQVYTLMLAHGKKKNPKELMFGIDRYNKEGQGIDIRIGKKNNQHFVNVPHARLIDKVAYKGHLVGIDVIETEESYTSKIDHLAFEPLSKQENYQGKRVKRGLFKSSTGKIINADGNGATGIGRKVFGDGFVQNLINSRLAFSHYKVNIL